MNSEEFSKNLEKYGIDKKYVVGRTKKKLILRCDEWPLPFKIAQKPHPRTRIEFFCQNCKMKHRMWWEEIKNGLKNNPSSIQDMINSYDYVYCKRKELEQSNPASLELSSWQARKIVNPNIIIPQHLINMHKNQKPDHIQNLWKELEDLGGEVRDLIYEGKGLYSFKIITPIGGYLSSGTKNEMINLVKDDCEAFDNAYCPFCKKQVSLERDFLGLGGCLNCLAIFGSIAKNFAEEAISLFEAMGEHAIYTMLFYWSEAFEEDLRTGYVWIDINYISQNFKEIKIPRLENFSKRQDVEIHFFEDEDGEKDDPLRVARCSECLHHLETRCGNRLIINSFCIFPHSFEEYEENSLGFELSSRIESLRNYQINSEAIVWNKFLKKFMERFVNIEDKDLRGFCVSENKFTYNLCPKFKLNPNNFNLKENGGALKNLGLTKIVFGESMQL